MPDETPAAAAQPKPPKRGPGRPPKKAPAPPLRKDGIVDAPTDAQNRLEFVYGDPTMLKSLFAYFKNLRAVDVHIRCNPLGLTFFTRDNAKTCRVVAEVPGRNMNHFFCDGTFWLGLNREHTERIFSSIDRSLCKITIVHRYDDPDSLVIVFKDAALDKECRYQVTVSTLERDDELFAAEALAAPEVIAQAPIEFQLTSKQFKKSVTDAGHHSETLTFEKLGELPLQLTYSHVGISYNEVYHSPDRIGLRSAVPKNTPFYCTVSVANIRSLANAMVTDNVHIFCREDGDLLLRSEIDALVLSTFTSINSAA
jgi:hypothetical protein